MSRPDAPPAKARFRLRLERHGPALWWDHARFLAALRRVLPALGMGTPQSAYITAGPTSPPGCASAYEYADLALLPPSTGPVLMALLGPALAPALRIHAVVRLPAWALDVRSALRARCFSAVCPANLGEPGKQLEGAAQWPWIRYRKGLAREMDLRPFVSDWRFLSGRVHFALECSDTAPKPAEVLASVLGVPLAEATLLPVVCTGVRFAPQPAYGERSCK